MQKWIKKIRISSSKYLNQKFNIDGDLQPFNQLNDIFSRAVWDEKINPKNFFLSYDITNYIPKKSKGFDHWDYAFRNASWHITDFIGERNFQENGKVEGFTDYYAMHTKGPLQKIQLKSPTHTTKRIKLAAKSFGAGMVGICALDRRWVYSHHFNRKTQKAQPLQLPKSLKYAIILIHPMDKDLSRTYPTALSGATTGLGYSESLLCANTLAQFITNLGYEAVASLNDTALSIPMAIEAGLGEYGRHGLLITPEYGPNVRISKVFTDIPLEVDQPIEFGVTEFCQICKKCADSCPVKAIPKEEPQSEPPNFSSLTKVKKWTINAEKCFKFWVGLNTDCAICIRICPYNKDYNKWWNRIGIRLANTHLRRWMLWLDDYLKFSQRLSAEKWWSENTKNL